MKQQTKIILVVTLLLALSIPTVWAAQPETPNLPELVQNIKDYLEDTITPSIEDIDNELSTLDTDMKTSLREHNTYIETKINEHEEHIITALRNHNSYIEGKLAEHASEVENRFTVIDGKLDILTGYVDETEPKLDTLSSHSLRMYTDVINRIEAVDTRVEELSAENQGAFESLDGRLTSIQTVLSSHIDDQSQYNQDMIEHLGQVEAYVDNVEGNQEIIKDSVDDIQGVLEKLAEIQSSIELLEAGSGGNVIMETDSKSGYKSPSGVFSQHNYDSVRDVRLTFKFAVTDDNKLELWCKVPVLGYQLIDILDSSDIGTVHHYEFTSDSWYFYHSTRHPNGATTVDMNIVTYRES